MRFICIIMLMTILIAGSMLNNISTAPSHPNPNDYSRPGIVKAQNILNPNSPFTVLVELLPDANGTALQLTIPEIVKIRPGDPFYSYLESYDYPVICGKIVIENGWITLQIKCRIPSTDFCMIANLIYYSVDQAHKIIQVHLFSLLTDCGIDADIAKAIVLQLHSINHGDQIISKQPFNLI